MPHEPHPLCLTPEALALFIKETTHLLVERNRARRPEVERMGRKLLTVEHEIVHIMEAIKRSILTASTKAALETAVAERARFQDAIKTSATKADKVAILLPESPSA